MFYNKSDRDTSSFKKFAVTAKKIEKASKAKETINRNNFLNPVKKHVSAARLNNFTKGFISKFERKPPNEISHRPKTGVFTARLEGNLEKLAVDQKKPGNKKGHPESCNHVPDGVFQKKKPNISILQLNEGTQSRFKPKVTSTPNEVYEEQILREYDSPPLSIKKDRIKEPEVRRFPLYDDISHISKNILKQFNKRSSDRRTILEKDLIFLRKLNDATTNENLLLESESRNESTEILFESELRNDYECFDESVESLPSCILEDSGENWSDESILEDISKRKRLGKEKTVSFIIFFSFYKILLFFYFQEEGYDYFGLEGTPKRCRDFNFEIDFDEPEKAKKCRQNRSQKCKGDPFDFFNLEYSALNVSTIFS